MRREDLLKKLQEGTEIDILVPSHNKTYTFKPLAVSHFAKLNKLIMEDSKELNNEIGNVITELSKGEINIKNCNSIDKIAILLALKNNGDYTKVVKTVHKCNKCNAENNIDFDLNNINTKYSLDINDSYETELNGLNFKLVLSYPTLLDQIEYDRIHAVNKAKESDKASYELYSTLFESNLIYIREIYCNGEIIDDFTNIGMKDKLTFLNRLNNKLVNIDKIITFIIERSNPISIDFECHKCTAINSNITIKTDNFII